MTSGRLLLIEDDVPLAELTCAYLTREGYQVEHFIDSQSALKHSHFTHIDLIICDVMLPGMTGFAALAPLVKQFECPLLFLTALDAVEDHIHGLELGACDYIVKPVPPALLLARIQANLRKQNPLKPHQIQLGALLLDKHQQGIWREQCLVNLTTKELDILWIFAEHPGQVLTREFLFEQIVGRPYDGLDRAMDAKISRLRRTLEGQPQLGLDLTTVHGRGYRLVLTP